MTKSAAGFEDQKCPVHFPFAHQILFCWSLMTQIKVTSAVSDPLHSWAVGSVGKQKMPMTAHFIFCFVSRLLL